VKPDLLLQLRREFPAPTTFEQELLAALGAIVMELSRIADALERDEES
jgi:hypothetical protein